MRCAAEASSAFAPLVAEGTTLGLFTTPSRSPATPEVKLAGGGVLRVAPGTDSEALTMVPEGLPGRGGMIARPTGAWMLLAMKPVDFRVSMLAAFREKRRPAWYK